MSGFIAIEGLDGSGKSTQIDRLTQYLNEKGVQTRFVHFPRLNDGYYGHLISRFLRGEFGDVAHVHPQLVAVLFAEDRKEFSATLRDWLDKGYFVLMDRYVLSNIAFQCAKLKEQSEKTYLRDWINEFEYQHNQIPRPDFSIYLDVPFDFVKRSLEARRIKNERDYLKGKDDIHENNYALQRAVQQEYEALCQIDPTIRRIRCIDSSNHMRPIDAIHQEIINMVRIKVV